MKFTNKAQVIAYENPLVTAEQAGDDKFFHLLQQSKTHSLYVGLTVNR
jgi:hypothetical protein